MKGLGGVVGPRRGWEEEVGGGGEVVGSGREGFRGDGVGDKRVGERRVLV